MKPEMHEDVFTFLQHVGGKEIPAALKPFTSSVKAKERLSSCGEEARSRKGSLINLHRD